MSLIKTAGNMTFASVFQNRAGKWLLGFLFWTLVGLSSASRFYFSSDWKRAVTYALGDWYVFAVLSIPVSGLARQFRFDASHRWRSLAVHALGGVLFALAYMALRA